MDTLSYENRSRARRPVLKVILILLACLIVPVLGFGLLCLGIGLVSFPWEGSGQLLSTGAVITLTCLASLALVRWVYTVIIRTANVPSEC